MTQTHTLTPPPLHGSLAFLDISPKKTMVMGFKLGTPFASHGKAFEALTKQGFESPPACLDQPVTYFLLEREPAQNGDFDVALGFEYEADQLKNLKVILTRDMSASEDPHEVVRDMEAALIDSMGKPHLLLDNTIGLSRENINTSNPSMIYGMFWSGSQEMPSKTTSTTDSTQFFKALASLGHGGALVSITGLLGSVMGCIDFFQGQRSVDTASPFLSFMKNG